MIGTVAITGATGFVGRRAARALSAAGLALRALARRPELLPESERDLLHPVRGDLLDDTALAKLVEGADAVVHCAGELADPRHFHSANVRGTELLARAAREAGLRRFVHVSSLAAREPGLSSYGESKHAGEEAMRAAFSGTGFILRPPAVYGPGDRATLPLIAQLTRSTAFLPGTPAQRFSLIHVDDLARAIAALVLAPDSAAAMYELDDGREDGYSWRDLAAIAGEAQGRQVKVAHLPETVLSAAAFASEGWSRLSGARPALTRGKVAELHHRDWVCRHHLLQKTPLWQPAIGFAEGFAQTLAWYRGHGWLPAVPGATRTAANARQDS
jgi:nucleoside-diphosphate-sugar epimerase